MYKAPNVKWRIFKVSSVLDWLGNEILFIEADFDRAHSLELEGIQILINFPFENEKVMKRFVDE